MEGILNLIRIEAETRNPLHARRIQLLKSALKKTGSHSDHLQKLEKNMEICDWESMTKDEFLIHLFAESADMTMSKIAMEILSGKKPTVAELRNKEELVDKFFRGDSANLVAVPVTGRANVLEFVHIVLSVDISQNGVTKHQGRI